VANIVTYIKFNLQYYPKLEMYLMG